MRELKKLGRIMSIVIDNCDDCPLEQICKSSTCDTEWERFFQSKVKEDGIESCRH